MIRAQTITFRMVVCLAIAAGCVNVFPWFFLHPGADAFARYALIDCFDWQFWHGDLNPGWCMHSNGELGSPVFIFYFPLTYYITALMYPLRSLLGMDTDGIYTASLALAGTVSFITCWLWLSDCFGGRIALLGSFLFLWMPYRSEMLFYRSAQPELWEVAFLPLLFWAVRRALTGGKPHWPGVSFIIIACLFFQIPAALAALIGAAIYILVIAGKSYRHWFGFGAAVVLAFAALAIYILPAHYFLAFLDPARLAMSKQIWVVRGIDVEDVRERFNVVAAFGLMSAFCLILSIGAWRKQGKIGDAFQKREILAWIIIAGVAFFLLFPLSKPIWYVLDLVAGPVIAPWRIQALIMMAAVYLFCSRIMWLLSEKQLKTFRGDYAMVILLMMIIGALLISQKADAPPGAEKTLRAINETVVIEYKTPWTDEDHITLEYMAEQAELGKKRDMAQVIGGRGKVSDAVITSNAIAFTATLENAGDVLVKHWYFPIWHASIDGNPAQIIPQEHTGEMILHVPKGSHAVVLTNSIYETIPRLYLLGVFISLAALVTLFIWRRKFIAS